jgi:ribosome-associated heat shock protein Hsp15
VSEPPRGHGAAPPAEPAQRLDKWLWVARLFKTRALAAEAAEGGRVHVDGQRAKPARAVRPGNRVRVSKGDLELEVVVLGLAAQRRPFAEASRLYQETAASREARERAAAERQSAPRREAGAGRPTKRDRRQLERVTGKA